MPDHSKPNVQQAKRSMMKRLPHFLIIGAMRCGTTTLMQYLARQPQIAAASTKEVHFFDHQHDRGAAWYAEQFGTHAVDPNRIIGEATPYYLFHPCVPQRVHTLLPDIKLIVILRDPVERALSHYAHSVAHGFETLSLSAALLCETQRLAGEEERLLAEPGYRSTSHQHFSYVARGRYAEQLRRWLAYFPAEQFLILQTEQLADQPQQTIKSLCRFVGIAEQPFDPTVRLNRAPRPPADRAVRAWLHDSLADDIHELETLLDRRMGWEPSSQRREEPMAQPIIISGMHRSGTSLIASVLAHAGLHIGDELMPSHPDNPNGYFEDLGFVELHEAMLHSRDRTVLVDRTFVAHPTHRELNWARRLVLERSHHELWGWKDPRTCLFLNMWRRILPDACYLFVYRNPLDVLFSLMRRNEPFMAGLIEALEAWYTYNQRILAFFATRPARCVLGHIDGILASPDKLATTIRRRSSLQIELSTTNVTAVYQPDELHATPLTAADIAELAQIHPEAVATYGELEQTARFTDPRGTIWQSIEISPTSLPPVERRARLIALCARLEPALTEQFYVNGARDSHSIQRDIQQATRHAEYLEQVAGEARQSKAAAEQYAKSLEEAHMRAETYARSLEERFAEVEQYAKSLEEARIRAETYARSLEEHLAARTQEHPQAHPLEANQGS